MKIAIVDDEPLFISQIEECIEMYQQSHSVTFSFSSFTSAEEVLFHLHEFDVFFLDIQMGGMNGIQLAKTIRKEVGDAQIIFVTNEPNFIFDGYQLQALNYLLKPIQREQVFYCLDKLYEGDTKSLIVQVDKVTKHIKLKDILFIESDGHYVEIHADQIYRIKQTLDAVKEELDDNFIQIHRSYIVQIGKIQELNKDNIQVNNEIIPIARGKYKEVYSAFINFFKRRNPS